MQNTDNIFEYAAESKLRFAFRGLISTEDLFDLSLENLDNIYKTLAREAREKEEESLLSDRSGDDQDLCVKIEIIKYIVADKISKNEKAKNAAFAKARADKIRSIIAEKQDAALKDMSAEDLQKMLEELSGE